MKGRLRLLADQQREETNKLGSSFWTTLCSHSPPSTLISDFYFQLITFMSNWYCQCSSIESMNSSVLILSKNKYCSQNFCLCLSLPWKVIFEWGDSCQTSSTCSLNTEWTLQTRHQTLDWIIHSYWSVFCSLCWTLVFQTSMLPLVFCTHLCTLNIPQT